MDKALIIVPVNNKGKFITKGYCSAFRELSYFVIEKKLYDLNINEINKIAPQIMFIYWSGLNSTEDLKEIINNYYVKETIFIHCGEYGKDIPDEYKSKENHYAFTSDSKTKRNRLLPAVEYKDYKTKFSGYKYNITFCGNPAQKCREEILAKIIFSQGPVNIFCRSFDFYKSVDEIYEAKMLDEYFLELYKQSYKGYVENQKELAQIYASTKINIDLSDENKKAINYRCLEVLSAGGFLICEKNKYLVKYFDDGKDLETFTTAYELTDKINFYMKNLNLAQMIAARGRKNAASNFIYTDRLKEILKVIYGKNIGSR